MVIPSSLLQEKKFELKFEFVKVFMRWVKGSGIGGSYSYSKALIVGSWVKNNIEKVGKSGLVV